MGAGILPTTIHNNKLYFLFGKENKFEDSAPGFSDFGGGTDNNESFLETAIREAAEELTGFLGNDNDVRKLMRKYGTYNIDYASNSHTPYRMHIFPFAYDEYLPFYYNNNQRFLQKRLDANVIKNSKIFEKAEIRWICVDELKKMRPQFRYYFQNIVDIILNQKGYIFKFILESQKKGTTKTSRPRLYLSKTRSKRNSFSKNKLKII
jgi:8-oxo-dGTP pyrophosphatase MutT (NUDIX family)